MIISSEKHHDYTTNNNNGGKLSGVLFTEDEIEVSKILLDLSFLMNKAISSPRFDYNWNTKKPRSVPSPLKRTKEASSPNTPLSFSSNDSDFKSMHSFLPKKREFQSLHSRKEELEATFKERMDIQEQLKESIEKVQLYRNNLFVENSELKAKKQKRMVNLSDEREKTKTACPPQMQPLLQLQTTPVIDQVHASAPKISEYHNQSPLIFHQISGVDDSNYEVGPSTSRQFHQYHHHQNSVVINDPVREVPLTATQFHHPAPLIHHQQYACMMNQVDHDPVLHRQRENYQFDLNVVPEMS